MADNFRHVIHQFQPIISKECTLLILGSVPSIKSVQSGFYYMHKQNRFWKIMSALLGQDLENSDYDFRIKKLLEHKIALYDTVCECDIIGSGDTTVKNEIISDIPKLILNTEIKTIFCNGNLSYRLLIKKYPELKEITVKLPSTSPANASFNYSKLLNSWNLIINLQ